MATSFVEQATLRLNSRATETRLRAVNRLLREMDRNAKKLATSLRKLPNMQNALGFRTTGANNAINDLRRLTAEIERVRRATSRPLGFTVREGSLSRIPVVLRQSVSQTDRLRTGVRNVGRELDRVSNKATYFQRTMARALRTPGYALGGEAYAAARATTRTALVAPVTMDSVVTTLRTAGFSADEVERIRGVAGTMSERYPQMSTAQLMELATEAAGSISDLDKEFDLLVANMEKSARAAAILAGATEMNTDEAVRQAKELSKISDIQGLGADPVAARAVEDAILRAVVASGGTLSVSQARNMAQQMGASKYAATPEALMWGALLRDEGGRMLTSEVRQFMQDATRSNLSDTKTQQQMAAGLRNNEGIAIFGSQVMEDSYRFAIENILPEMIRRGIDTFDPAAVTLALENEFGFNSGAARGGAALIAQRNNIERQVMRAGRVDLEYPLESPAIRVQAEAVRAQFQNVAEQALGQFLPAVSMGLTAATESLSNIGAGKGGASDYATLAASAAPLGMAAALDAMMHTESRPLGAAALGLSASAMQLSGAAAALTGAAGVQAGGSMLGKGKGLLGWGARAAAGVGAVWGATALLGGGARADGETTMADLPGPPAFLSDMLAWTRNTIDGLNEASDESARTWERSSDMVVANVADTMVMRAPEWGEAMANSVESRMTVAGDALAEKIRGALRTPVQVASGIAAAVAGLDTGSMTVGD